MISFENHIKPLLTHPEFSNFSFRHPIIRILKYQLLTKPFGFSKIKKLASGPRIAYQPNSSSTSSFFYFGYPDFEEMSFIRDQIKKDEVFVDVGANIGGYSLLIAGLGAKVISFEPLPHAFGILQRNVALNPDLDIETFNIGISNQSGQLYFTNDLDTGNRVISSGEVINNKSKIEVSTLDRMLADVEPVIIKIDVEGHELNVIKGADETLKKNSLTAIIMETFRYSNFQNDRLREIEKILSDHGFLPYGYDFRNRQLIRLYKESDGGQNTIYFRSRKADEES